MIKVVLLLWLLLLDCGSLLLLLLLQWVLLLQAVEWLGGGGSLRLPDADVAEVGGNISNTLGGPMVDDDDSNSK